MNIHIPMPKYMGQRTHIHLDVEHVRGFFGIHPLPYHRSFHHWMAGANARFLVLIGLWHVAFVAVGFLLGKLA